MQAEDVIPALPGRDGEVDDRDRRGVGSENRARVLDHVGELPEDSELLVSALDHGLDHKLAISQHREIGHEAHAIACAPGRGGVELAARDPALQRVAKPCCGPAGGIVAGLDEDHVDVRPSAHLGDARAHDAAADDTDTHYRLGLRPGTHRNASDPVSAPPTTSAWTSAVPS